MRAPCPRRGPALVALGLALVVALVFNACGVPTDDEPRAITAETTTIPPAASSGPSANTATIYLSSPTDASLEELSELVAVARNLDGPPTPLPVLDSLFEGATGAEVDRGLVSLIPQGTTILDGSDLQEGGRLTVNLSEEWSDLQAPEDVGAYAQVVLTATDLTQVNSVSFLVDGEPVEEVPTDGDPKTRVTAEDYSDLDPSV